MFNKIKNKAIIFLIIIIFFNVFSLCSCKRETADIDYIDNSLDFMNALKSGTKKIYVNDICFDEDTEINLNYPVEIIGKENKSLFENVHIVINGSNVSTELLNISISNIVFDGKNDKDNLPLEEGKTFDEIFGDFKQYHCIDGSIGYFSLSINNSEILNYLHEDGPAIYINNNTNYRDGKKILNITNSKIYNNISNAGTVKVFSDILETNIDNCDFYSNLARAGQGIAVGNGKTTITNTNVHNNDFFRFVNHMERKLPQIFHDDKQTFNGITTNALGGCCGAIFIGGSHTVIDNCKINNNKTIFGGGIGIINAQTLNEDEKIEIKNTEINNNTAMLSGGAIYLESNQGETTYFINCQIMNNTALENGSVIYTTTYSPDSDKSYGGNVEFIFSSIVNNTSMDNNTFKFYDLLKEELSGTISLKGCFVIDDSSYESTSDNYNYISTKNDAILSEDKIEIIVPVDIYKKWNDVFSNNSKDREIGYLAIDNASTNFPYWIIIVVSALILAIILIIIFIKKETKKDKVINYNDYTFEEILNKVSKEYEGLLTKTEIIVATYLLYNYSRKEIAQKLFVSDETIKSHLSNIYKKISVSSKVEFKSITERKIF